MRKITSSVEQVSMLISTKYKVHLKWMRMSFIHWVINQNIEQIKILN